MIRKIEGETCLTDEGKLVMIELLGGGEEVLLVETYLGIGGERERLEWIKSRQAASTRSLRM